MNAPPLSLGAPRYRRFCHHLPQPAVIRLLPGALGDDRSPAEESFSNPDLLATTILPRHDEWGEVLKNLALGRVLQYMQAAFRRKMGRTYRSLLRGAIGTMAQALAEVKAEPEIGPREVQLMEVALQQYHDHLG